MRRSTWIAAAAVAVTLIGTGPGQARADACAADAKGSYARVELYGELT